MDHHSESGGGRREGIDGLMDKEQSRRESSGLRSERSGLVIAKKVFSHKSLKQKKMQVILEVRCFKRGGWNDVTGTDFVITHSRARSSDKATGLRR